MPVDNRTVEGAYMSAKVKFDRMWSNIMVNFYDTEIKASIGMMLGVLTPEQREQLRAMNPQAFDTVVKTY